MSDSDYCFMITIGIQSFYLFMFNSVYSGASLFFSAFRKRIGIGAKTQIQNAAMIHINSFKGCQKNVFYCKTPHCFFQVYWALKIEINWKIVCTFEVQTE